MDASAKLQAILVPIGVAIFLSTRLDVRLHPNVSYLPQGLSGKEFGRLLVLLLAVFATWDVMEEHRPKGSRVRCLPVSHILPLSGALVGCLLIEKRYSPVVSVMIAGAAAAAISALIAVEQWSSSRESVNGPVVQSPAELAAYGVAGALYITVSGANLSRWDAARIAAAFGGLLAWRILGNLGDWRHVAAWLLSIGVLVGGAFLLLARWLVEPWLLGPVVAIVFYSLVGVGQSVLRQQYSHRILLEYLLVALLALWCAEVASGAWG